MNAVTTTDNESLGQALARFESQITERAVDLQKSLPAHISMDKFQRTLMAAVKSDPELLKADRRSLINAVEKCALDCLLPDKREAALVIFTTRKKGADGQFYPTKEVVYMPMVYGLRKKILQSGEISTLTVGIVYKCEYDTGRFLYEEGSEAMLRHKPMLDMSIEQAADDQIVAFYSMARMKDGSLSYDVMSRARVDRIRELSQTGATKDRWGKDRTSKGPWADHYGEMGCKTVMRHHSKVLPMSGDLIIDIEGREIENAVGAARLLSVQADEPVVLPPAEELAGQLGHDQQDDEMVDTDTGEIVDQPSAGPTEVGEETARQLDAGDQGDQSQDPEPEPQPEAKAPAKPKPAPKEEPEPAAEDAFEWQDNVDMIKSDATAAKSLAALKDVEKEYLKVCASWPKGICDGIEAHLTARRNVLNGEAGK
jgi:recombination protein RecT